MEKNGLSLLALYKQIRVSDFVTFIFLAFRTFFYIVLILLIFVFICSFV